MTSGHTLSVTAATATVSVAVYFNTPNAWVALGTIGIICLAVVAVVYRLSQNRGETKQN